MVPFHILKLRKKNNKTMKEINQKQLEKFRKLGLIDEIALRNYYIRADFKLLKQRRIKVSDSMLLLSQKYNLSESSINLIVYSKYD